MTCCAFNFITMFFLYLLCKRLRLKNRHPYNSLEEMDINNKEWQMWIGPVGVKGSAFDFTEEENFGKVATVT